ncbi:membrane protein insertase YidC [Candidatus Haliotispira prima]|uniref:Membrane protein insertase YidC n=1 Tax=Candidatus Haliotispira prima TaxID=3034016 RepID=A0ABY8MGW8_9SPIO|nr:membrane protein insertase YidC [Candidatus Haliotispira prima]
MSHQKPDRAKRMQTMGLIFLTVLFGSWMYYQSWSAPKTENRLPQEPAVDSSRPDVPDSAADTGPGPGTLRLVGTQTETESPSDSDAGEEDPEAGSGQGLIEESVEPIESIEPGKSTESTESIVVETNVYRAVLSPEGAVLRSLVLKEHNNNDQPLEMVRSVDSGLYPFTVYLGDLNNGRAVMLPFDTEKIGPLAYRFTAEFNLENELESAAPYILEKTLEFARDEYMIKVSVRLQRKSGEPLFRNDRKVIYSLYYGPQMGPEVDHIGSNRTAADMRSYVYFNGKKSKTISLSRSGRDKRLDSSPIWAGMSGKYFGVFVLPSRSLDVYWSGADVRGLGQDASGKPLESSQFLFERRASRPDDNLADDTFYYYIGPLLSDELGIFNNSGDNEFGLSDASLNSVVKFSLGFIEEPVKWILTWLYGFTYNYGLAIILFALIVRLLLYPLTVKSFKSSGKMRAVQPKMKELQEKYKGDARRLQQEMSELYRREQVNPIGGCLPLLVQMPILIAIANLFYRYFELRGATFIPGWIGDLSSPDLIYSLDVGFWVVPLRLLPLIYLGSQLISSKLMQASQPPMQNKMQQRMFTVYMPIFFSIILYNMPSGLILYWTISNLLMMVQQLLMTKYYKVHETEIKHEADAVVARQSKNYIRHTSRRSGSIRNETATEPTPKPKNSGSKNSGQSKAKQRRRRS